MVETSADDPQGSRSNETASNSAPLDTPTEFTSRRLVGLQVLRGIAALMVVFHHILHQSPGYLALWPTNAWQSGVDLFFVISGFVMVYVTHKRERSPRIFLAMRAARIIPVYWFFTISAALLMIVMPQLFRSNELTFRHVMFSLLFLPHHSETGTNSPVIKQGWTLNYEVFFYIIFALAMAFSARHRATISITTLAILSLLGYSLLFTNSSIGVLEFYLNNMILEFGFGMIIAKLYLAGKLDRLQFVSAIALTVAGFVSIFTLDPFCTTDNRALVYGLPATMIVAGVLALENRVSVKRVPVMQFIGDASYSIYLVHIFPIAVIRSLWSHGPLPMAGLLSFTLFATACILSTIGLSAISYRAVERQSLKYLRKRIQLRFNGSH